MLDWFSQRWNDFLDFMWQLVLTVGDLIKDVLLTLCDMFFSLTITLLSGMSSLFSGLNVVSYISAIPPEAAGVMSAVGLSEAMGMIITALTIRFMLQLIPFVRLGS